MKGYNSQEIRDWISCDDDCPTYEEVSDDEIVMGVINRESNEACDDDDEDDEDVIVQPPPPKTQAAIDGLSTTISWLESSDADPVMVIQARAMLAYAKSVKAAASKQKPCLIFLNNCDTTRQ